MKFSLYYLPGFDADVHTDAATLYQQTIEQCTLADQIGVDKAWFAEHHLTDYGGDVPNQIILMAAIAQHTKNLKLGTGGVALPLHRPLEKAEELSMLDNLCQGRLEIGVVRAFLHYEYDAYNVDMGESRARFNESVAIIKGLFANESFSYDGEFSKLNNVELRPRPIQKHPRMSVGTIMTKESFEFAGHQGLDLSLVPYLLPFEFVAEMIGVYKDSLREAGHNPDDFNIMAQYFYYGHADPAIAKAVPSEALLTYFSYVRNAMSGDRWSKDYKGYEGIAKKVDALMDYEMMYNERTLIGDPDKILRSIETIEAGGITEVALMPQMPKMPHDKIMETLEFLGTDVIPAYKQPEKKAATA